MKTNQLQTNIPDGWKFHKLDDLLTFVVDNRGKTPPIQSSGIPMAEVNAIGDKNIKYSEITKFVSEETYKTWFRKHLEKNDILFSTVGRTASCSIYTADIKTVIAQNLIGLRFGKDNPEFMFYLLTQDKNNQEFKNIEMSAAQPSVKVSQMIHLEFLLPPLSEQNRIVSVLQTWDSLAEKLNEKIEVKKHIKKGLIQDLLSGKKRLSNFKDKWNIVKLSDIGVFSKGSGITKEELSETGFNAVRYGELYTKHNIQIKNIYSFIPSSIIQNTKKMQYGDILFAGSGETIDEIGKSAAYLLKEDCYAGGDIVIFRPKKADSLFLSYFLNNGEARKKLREMGQGQSVVHIYKSDIENLKVCIPSEIEQIAIANILTIADKEITELEKKLSIIREQKLYLLNNLITGKIRTPETLSTKLTK